MKSNYLVFLLIIAYASSQTSLISSGPTNLSSNSNGIYISTVNSIVKSVKIGGVKEIFTQGKTSQTLLSQTGYTATFFPSNDLNHETLIEITAEKIDEAIIPGIIATIQYNNEDNELEYIPSDKKWFCNNYPCSFTNEKSKVTINNIDHSSSWLCNEFNSKDVILSYVIRQRRRSLLVDIQVEVDDYLAELIIGTNNIAIPPQSSSLYTTIKQDILDGDSVIIKAYDAGNVGESGNGYSIQAIITFEDSFMRKRQIITNTNDWKCNDKPAANGVFKNGGSNKLSQSTSIWKEKPFGLATCKTDYQETASTSLNLSITVQMTGVLTELKIGKEFTFTPTESEGKLYIIDNQLISLHDEELITIKGYKLRNIASLNNDALQVKISFVDSSQNERVIQSNIRDWSCNGRTAFNIPGAISLNSKELSGVDKIYKSQTKETADNSKDYIVCYMIYRNTFS